MSMGSWMPPLCLTKGVHTGMITPNPNETFQQNVEKVENAAFKNVNVVYDENTRPMSINYSPVFEDRAADAWIMYQYWSRSAEERVSFYDTFIQSGFKVSETQGWTDRGKRIFGSRLVRYFNDTGFYKEYLCDPKSASDEDRKRVLVSGISTNDDREAEFETFIQKGKMSEADVAMARYARYMSSIDTSNGQMESDAPLDLEEEAKSLFLDEWHPYNDRMSNTFANLDT